MEMRLPQDFKDFLQLLNVKQVEYLLDGVSTNIISLADLRVNKQAAGRLKDLNDLENLPQP
jgi:hypothetical protein